MADTKPITDEEFEAANRAGAARRARGVAVSVRYFSTARRLAIELSTGATLTIPVDLVEGLAGQPDIALADVMLGSGGEGLRFRQIDADVSVAGLMDGIFGSPRWMAGERDNPATRADAEMTRDQFLRHFAYGSTEKPTAHHEHPVSAIDPLSAIDANIQRAVDAIVSRTRPTTSGVTVAGVDMAFRIDRSSEIDSENLTFSPSGRFGEMIPLGRTIAEILGTGDPRLMLDWMQRYGLDDTGMVRRADVPAQPKSPEGESDRSRTGRGGNDIKR